MVIKNTMSLH